MVIGRHADMLQKVINLLHVNNYDAKGATTNHEAIQLFSNFNFDAVIIGGGVDEESRVVFHTEFLKRKPSIKVIDAHPHTILNDLCKAFD